MLPVCGGALALQDIRISLRGRPLLAVDAIVQPGEVLTIMGPSGSGKSSLLAFIGGFLDPAFTATGRAVAGGRTLTDISAAERHAGILFQDPLLFPHMSVGGNLVFALPQSVRGRTRRRALAEEALRDIGLDGLFDRDPATLSGGQKARVALARVLLAEPCILMLDEPFSKLDAELREQMRRLVFARATARNLPVLLVTHDAADADAAGGPVIAIGQP